MADAQTDDGAIARADASGTLLGMITTFVTTPVGGTTTDESGTPRGNGATPSTTPSGATPAATKRVPRGEIWWRELLTRLKHPEAAHLRAFLQSRLRQFLVQSVDDMPESGAGSISDQVQKLQRDILNRMQRSGPWSDLTEAEWAQTSETVERFVASQLHDHVIGARTADNTADDRLSERCDALVSFVTADQLGVPASALAPRLTDHWATAQDFLHRIGAYKDPWRKLLCIDRCCRQLYGVLHTAAAQARISEEAGSADAGKKAASADQDASAVASPGTGGSDADSDAAVSKGAPQSSHGAPRGSADDLVPCVIWCLLRSNPGRLHSHLAFIERFRPASRTKGSLGYHMTVIQSAMHFIERVGPDALSIDAEEFKSKMSQGEAEAAKKREVAQRLLRLGEGHVEPTGEASDASAGGPGDIVAEAGGDSASLSLVAAMPDLSLLAAAPTAAELPLTPALPAATDEALEKWREQRFRFLERDPASLTMAEVPQLLEEYRNMVATCISVAEALGLPPPDVALLRPPPLAHGSAVDDSDSTI